MARLIPAITDDRTPPGERAVFTMLSAGPDDWVAFHSLDLAPFNRNLRTEIDFVVVVPDSGIVCIEVKSHDHIDFIGDKWVPPVISRSPFKQAADGRYAFYRRLKELAPSHQSTPVLHLCIFPNARFDVPANLSVMPWELIDRGRFRSYANGKEFCADIREKMQRGIEADAALRPLAAPLTRAQIEAIVVLCAPVQKWHPERRTEIIERERAAEKVLREQQKPVLQLAALNPQLIVTGPAGTGKTLIASEIAYRSAASGKRIGLLCFNSLVGEWIRDKARAATPPLPTLIAGRAIRVMADMTGITIPPNPTAGYWENELPDLLEERITDPDFRAQAAFDYLILDEVQDLLARPRIWQSLSAFLVGGFEKGSYVLLGDLNNQVLSDRPVMLDTLAALEESSRPARWELSENCRNYPIVGDAAVVLAGFSSKTYSGYRRTGGHIGNYDVHFYADDGEQVNLLRELLRNFKAKGYQPDETTVLSFCAAERSAAEKLRQNGPPLRPLWKPGTETPYGTIHAFKGMENKNVILTDVLLTDVDFHRALFYVGMTRATESVRVLCDVNSRNALTEWLTRNSTHA